MFPQDSWIGKLVADSFVRKKVPAPKKITTSFSVHLCINMLASGNYVAAIAGSALAVNGGRFGLASLAVDLRVPKWRVGIVTLRGRTLRPSALQFIESVRNTVSALRLRA
jgi:DNA-binding transcriptional LysR family regulator